MPGMALYGATKAALESLTRAQAALVAIICGASPGVLQASDPLGKGRG
ncbi:hypothetical protein [Streptomyces asiaticus]